MSLALRFPPKN